MAKRELSSTLRNLKFMQRAAQKEEKPKKDEEQSEPDGNFVSRGTLVKKCMVIMEGDPHPGSIKGRMSFLNFNPAIDKLNGEAASCGSPESSATSSGNLRGKTFDRENRPYQNGPEGGDAGMPHCRTDEEIKRKQPEVGSETRQQNNLWKNVQGDPEPSSNESRSSLKKPKREKLDWNVLRPSKGQSKKG
ncbi:hypothetical protein Nepgr_014105 [Nepenthes gracilis]|uniref:M-phase phosphoprotein 6 n=1 Tax=Nepenthes gracilis TaxID=150966 RepID=A0AAD3SKC0_NEPGR|nr:hypothetical protein Nepgr_014105 [Nepenthes gracilis]